MTAGSPGEEAMVQASDWRPVRRVLAVRTDDPSDVLLLGPALRVLKGALPDAHLTLLASPVGALAAPLLPWVDEVVAQRFIWQDAAGDEPVDVEAQVDLIGVLERRSFDAALIFTRHDASPWPAAYITYLAGIKVRVGQSAERGGRLLTHVVRPLPPDAHQVDRNLHLLEASGLAVAGRRLELEVPEEAQAAAEALLLRSRILPGEPFVVVAPGADARSRRYAASGYAEVCRALADRAGVPVVVVGGLGDVALAAEVAASADRQGVTCVAGQATLPELAGVIQRSACVVTNHSVVMQLGDAFRRPLVVLFAGTDPEAAWRPRSGGAAVLRRATACAPCQLAVCPYGNDCLSLPPALVANEAIGRLGSVAGWDPSTTAAVPALAASASAPARRQPAPAPTGTASAAVPAGTRPPGSGPGAATASSTAHPPVVARPPGGGSGGNRQAQGEES